MKTQPQVSLSDNGNLHFMCWDITSGVLFQYLVVISSGKPAQKVGDVVKLSILDAVV